MRSPKRREEKKRSNRDKSNDKDNTSSTNAKRHAYPNTDQTAYNNLQQIDIIETWDPIKRGAGRKNVGAATNPKNKKHNTGHTNATCHAYRNVKQTAHNNLLQWYRRNMRSTKEGREEDKKLEPRQAQEQAQRKPNHCNMWCTTFFRASRSHQRNMRSNFRPNSHQQKKGREEKKCWNRDEPKGTQNPSHTNPTSYVFLLNKARTAQVGLRAASVGFLTRTLKVSCFCLPILWASWGQNVQWRTPTRGRKITSFIHIAKSLKNSPCNLRNS